MPDISEVYQILHSLFLLLNMGYITPKEYFELHHKIEKYVNTLGADC